MHNMGDEAGQSPRCQQGEKRTTPPPIPPQGLTPPTASSSSSNFQSPAGDEIAASPVYTNLPQASSYLDSPGLNTSPAIALYSQAKSMERSSNLQFNVPSTPGVPSNSETKMAVGNSQTLPESNQHSSSASMELNDNLGLKREKSPMAEPEANTSAHTPTSGFESPSLTSSNASLQRLSLSPPNSIQRARSLKSSESLKPPLPIISSTGEPECSSITPSESQTSITDQLSRSHSARDSPSSNSLPESQSMQSPSIAPRSSKHTNSPSANKLQSHPSVLRPAPLSLGETESLRQGLHLSGDTYDALASNNSQNPITPSDQPANRLQPSLPVTRSPIVMTPSATLTSDTPTSSSIPALENYTFSEMKAMLGEKLIQLSQVQAQNAQLWTLVNKQRTMIFDLQKDLDGAVEQNEKYRAIIAKQKHDFQSSSSLASTNSSSIFIKSSKGSLKEKSPSLSHSHSPSASQSSLKKHDLPATKLSTVVGDNASLHSQKSTTSTKADNEEALELNKKRISPPEKHRPPPISLPANNASVNSTNPPLSASTRVSAGSSEPFTPSVSNGSFSAASKSTFEFSDTTPRRSQSSVSWNDFEKNFCLTIQRNILVLLSAQ